MESLIFLKQVTGFYYYRNPQKPFRKFRMGEIHEGIRKNIQTNQQQKISILKYSMLSDKTVDLLRNKLSIFQKIQQSIDVPKSILKYYCHFFNLAESNLYIISQFFSQTIPLELKVVHPVQLMTVISSQLLEAFIYLESIQIYTTFFTIYINQKLQIKIADFGFQYEINSFNYQYQSDSNLCVDWVWGYIPGQKHREIYDRYLKQNLTQLSDQNLKKQKSKKLYTWLYGLIIYNKLSSTILTNQKYKIRNSTGEYWYVWCCLLKCLFIREDIIDYSKSYKMVAMDVLDILKKFQNCYFEMNMMAQEVQIPQLSEQLSSQYFQFFTDIQQLQINQQFTQVQVKSAWLKQLLTVLKKYVFQPYNLRVTVSQILRIIHGPSQQNSLLGEQMIKLYVDTQFQFINSLKKSEQIQRQQEINYVQQHTPDPQFQKWYERFLFQPEPEVKKQGKKPHHKKQSKQELQKTRSYLFPFIKTLFYEKKQLKQKNAAFILRLSYIEIYQQIFKGLCKKKHKNEQKQIKQLEGINKRQIQQFKPIIKQLSLIEIYISIIQALEEINYNRNQYQKQRSRIFSTHCQSEQIIQSQTQPQPINLNNRLGNILNKEQQQYNSQICIYVKIRQKLRIRLQQIYKVLCQYNYVMATYLSQVEGIEQKNNIISNQSIVQFFKKTTNLIVIKKIHEVVLAKQLRHRNQQICISQFRQYVRQFRKITSIITRNSYSIFLQANKTVNQIKKLTKDKQYFILQYYLQLLMVQLLGWVNPICRQLDKKSINTHTGTFICSFLKQKMLKVNRLTVTKVQQNLNQDINKIKFLIELLHKNVPVSIKIPFNSCYNL